MGNGKPRGLNAARKLRVHRRNKYVREWNIETSIPIGMKVDLMT